MQLFLRTCVALQVVLDCTALLTAAYCAAAVACRRYVKGWQLLDEVEAATGEQLLTQEQRQWVFGGTIESLFPGGWQQS
jgi:hypothetical protein